MVSDGCLYCPVCLSVTLVYCGQTVGWVKMTLGMQVGLGPSHIVLDGDQLSPKKGVQQPLHFRPMCVVAKQLYGSCRDSSNLVAGRFEAKFHYAILVADRSEAGRRPASSLLAS